MMSHSIIVAMLVAVVALPQIRGEWSNLRSGGKGPGTIYGYGENSRGSCSYGKNMADTTGLPWSTAPEDASDGGTGLAKTFIALNKEDLNGGTACGSCIWFRGTGPGIGVEDRRISGKWQYGVVDNVCPECKKGALDLARSFDVGDGIWTVEWHAVPCRVGDSMLHYSFPIKSPYFFNMVVSNGRVPVKSVTAEIDGKDVKLTRTSNNQWAYWNSAGSYKFPLKLKVTPTCGESVTDVVESISGGYGKAQFGREGCPTEGNPVSGNSSPNDIKGTGTAGLSTESASSERADTKPKDEERQLSDKEDESSDTPEKDDDEEDDEPSPSKTSEKDDDDSSSETTEKTPKTSAPTPAPSTPSPSESEEKSTPKPSPSEKKSAPTSSKSNSKKNDPLNAWWQCGDFYGRYRNTECVSEGFSCVKLNKFYWQCRNDADKYSSRRLLRSL